jgi:uncharacterized membrane protein YfcA
MGYLEVMTIAGAGLCAGAVNTIVGSGSLITFPALLAVGYPPFVANITNTTGLVTGSISGAVGYRRELAGQLSRVLVLGAIACCGGVAGGVFLLVLPGAFQTVVPYLILLAVVLMLLQPRLQRRRSMREAPAGAHRIGLGAATLLTGVYGGYFGAAQGVILIAVLGSFLVDDLQRLNALKNVITAIVNAVAAALFVAVAPVQWLPAGLIAGGAVLGGQLGAILGRRLSPRLLRYLIAAMGVAVAVRLLID